MKNPKKDTEPYDVYFEEVIEPSPSSAPTPKRGISAFLAGHSARMLAEDAMWEAGNNRCRALIAKSAMEETAALAFAANRFSCISPQGKEIYQRILMAYGEGAIKSIERW